MADLAPTISSLTAEQQDDLRATVDRIRFNLFKTAENIIEIGLDLTHAKKMVGHGHFLPWLAYNFDMSERTAQNYMRVAKKFGGNSAIFSDLPAQVVRLLSEPDTPEEVKDNVIKLAERGEKVTPADVKKLKEDLKEAKAQAKEIAAQKRASDAELSKANSKVAEAVANELFVRSQVQQLQQKLAEKPAEPQGAVSIDKPVDHILVTMQALWKAATPGTQERFLSWTEAN
jgi:hypothetical protein